MRRERELDRTSSHDEKGFFIAPMENDEARMSMMIHSVTARSEAFDIRH
jgi:hypothetical protein